MRVGVSDCTRLYRSCGCSSASLAADVHTSINSPRGFSPTFRPRRPRGVAPMMKGAALLQVFVIAYGWWPESGRHERVGSRRAAHGALPGKAALGDGRRDTVPRVSGKEARVKPMRPRAGDDEPEVNPARPSWLAMVSVFLRAAEDGHRGTSSGCRSSCAPWVR